LRLRKQTSPIDRSLFIVRNQTRLVGLRRSLVSIQALWALGKSEIAVWLNGFDVVGAAYAPDTANSQLIHLVPVGMALATLQPDKRLKLSSDVCDNILGMTREEIVTQLGQPSERKADERTGSKADTAPHHSFGEDYWDDGVSNRTLGTV
jgi:hypothetical protein